MIFFFFFFLGSRVGEEDLDLVEEEELEETRGGCSDRSAANNSFARLRNTWVSSEACKLILLLRRCEEKEEGVVQREIGLKKETKRAIQKPTDKTNQLK
jgi:hypothetical protein